MEQDNKNNSNYPLEKMAKENENPDQQKVSNQDILDSKTNVGRFETYDSNRDEDEEEDDDDTDDYDKIIDDKYGVTEDFQRPGKFDLIVGFLRCFTFLQCATSVFAVTLSLIFTLGDLLEDGQGQNLVISLKIISSLVLLLYLLVCSILITVDAVATVTFRWREYGELAFRHTDATSGKSSVYGRVLNLNLKVCNVIFLFGESRWKLRLLGCLTLASGAPLQTTKSIFNLYGKSADGGHSQHAVICYLTLMSLGLVSLVLGYLLHRLPTRFRNVPWLDDVVTDYHVDDEGDVWRSSTEFMLQRTTLGELITLDRNFERLMNVDPGPRTSLRLKDQSTSRELTCGGSILEWAGRILYFLSYMLTISMHVKAALLMETDPWSFEFWARTLSLSCTSLMSLYLVVLMVMKSIRLPHSTTPFLTKLYVPFTLSSALRLLLDLNKDTGAQIFFSYSYCILMLLILCLEIISHFTARWRLTHPNLRCPYKFFQLNFYNCQGAYKKCVRMVDTLGRLLALSGLVLGICSLICDQYDLEFKLEGELKDVIDSSESFSNGSTKFANNLESAYKDLLIDYFESFSNGRTKFANDLESAYRDLDIDITCDDVYKVLAGGTISTFIARVVPGTGGAYFDTKTSYYVVKAAWSMKRLFNSLRNATKNMWRIVNVVLKLNKFGGDLAKKHFKTLTIGGTSVTLLSLLPMMPPVIVGLHIFFSSFWPKRVLFFHASQRNRFINGLRSHWIGILILLVLALITNTVLVDEVVNAFNEAMPIVNVHVNKKLGWKFSLAASACSMSAALAFITSYTILGSKTRKNHDRITKEEQEWKELVESKKKTTYSNPFGPKIEFKNQIKYKKERIGGWNWVLPITLCLISCALGVVANLYPKIDIYTEPKGSFGRHLDQVLSKIDNFEKYLEKVKEDTESDCLPFATFADVFRDNLNVQENLLMPYINAFSETTENKIGPLKQILQRTRRQLVPQLGEDLFDGDVTEKIQQLDIRFLGMILLLPRLLALSTLIFGSLVMARATCQMKIIPALEPRKIVDFFGSTCIFSIIFVLFSQLAVFNILSDIGVPYFRVTVSLGLGFLYDIAADAIMCSVYIGMKNEYFFAIPRRKVTVSYTVPGVSDNGPNQHGKVL